MRGSPVLPGGKTVFIKEDKIFPGSFSCFFQVVSVWRVRRGGLVRGKDDWTLIGRIIIIWGRLQDFSIQYLQ